MSLFDTTPVSEREKTRELYRQESHFLYLYGVPDRMVQVRTASLDRACCIPFLTRLDDKNTQINPMKRASGATVPVCNG